MTISLRQPALRLIMVIGLLFLGACSTTQFRQDEIRKSHTDFYKGYEDVVHNFNAEIEVSLSLRKGAVEFYKQEILEGDDQYFNAEDISRIQKAVGRYAENRKILLNDIAYRYRKLIEDVSLNFTTERATELELVPSVMGIGGKNILHINPNDELGREYIGVIKLGLASALTLYDNFIIAIMPYHEKSDFRRNIDYDNIDNELLIKKISGNFRRLDNYKDTLRVIEFNDIVREWVRRNPESELARTKDNGYFNVLIDGSYTNSRIKEITLWDSLAFRTERFRRKLRDILFDFGDSSMNAVSKIFGNGVGLIESREGYLKDIPASHKKEIEAELKPGDILLEKTPFRLTDRFIPGHWGHVAIWVGDKEQLQDLGVWDELPNLYTKAQTRFGYKGPSFQEQIESGEKIIEALRPGVQINSLDHFLNVDDMAVLRDPKVDKQALKNYVIRAFEQVGKEYDFNFDVETDTKIVCSELAFVAYHDYDWPVEKTAGRYTISPDHVGEKASGEGPFVPVMLYHDGKIVESNLQENFNRLMNGQYKEVRTELKAIN